MKKILLGGVPLLAILLGTPMLATLTATMSTQAAAECRDQAADQGAVRRDQGGAGPVDVDEMAGDAPAAPDVDTAVSGEKDALSASNVQTQLMKLRFAYGYAAITAEQARNAVTIAQVARDLGVPRYGLQIAIATAIQESKLVNLAGGDADSGGLFQQRPSSGWGSRAQFTNPVLATRAFFGQAQHTNNPGLLDLPGWQQLPLTEAAARVQRPRADLRGEYAKWESIAGDITDLLGADLPNLPGHGSSSSTENCRGDTIAPVTMGTLNLLGAGHTDGQTGGGREHAGFQGWEARLPGAIGSLEAAGITVAALQEVHGPQAKALANRYSEKWGMFPASGPTQNKVIWDRNFWTKTDARLVNIPYFNSSNVGMPLVQLTSVTTGQAFWVWSIHNPANSYGDAAELRREALRREVATLGDLSATGVPTVIMGDFNDGRDAQNTSHCALTPTMTNAFGGSAQPCKKPRKDAPIDHIYGANLTWSSARVDKSTQTNKISDHPLVVATTAGSNAGCAVAELDPESDYNLGPVKPELTQLVNIVAPMFDIKTVGGYRPSATDPNGHPAGLAADFMTSTKAQGDALAAYAREHAGELGIDYIIWRQRIWSVRRASAGWRPMGDRGSDTENHKDHVHINVKPNASIGGAAACDDVVYPIPATYIGTDNHNWHESGPHWSQWHTGTDFSVPCGTPVYAAHAGSIEVDTTQPWAGPWLVKVKTGAGSLTTWYAHMGKVTVSRGETVRPGQQIGIAGAEGNASGCHLHFEVHLKNGPMYGGDNVDPSAWLGDHARRSRLASRRVIAPGPDRDLGDQHIIREVDVPCSVSDDETHTRGPGRSRWR